MCILASLLFWFFFFFLCFPSSPPLLLLSFFRPALSLSISVPFLYFFFLSFWFKCCDLPLFLLLLLSFFRLALSLSVPFLYSFFFLGLFGSSAVTCPPSHDVSLKYLFEIFIPFALWHVIHSFFIYLCDISLGFIFIFLLYYSNTSA